MPNSLLSPPYWLAQKLREIDRKLAALATQPVLARASSDGPNGSMSIIKDAVNGQPAIQFTIGSLLAQIYQAASGAVQITGGLQVTGSKNFVMNHPTHPGWILRHASTESPVNGVEYWGTGTVTVPDTAGATTGPGTVVVNLPQYFEALTRNRNRAVLLTAQGTNPVHLSAETITRGSFTVHGPLGTVFSWLVKAERKSQNGDWSIDFNAEEIGTIPGTTPPPTQSTGTAAVLTTSSMTADPAAPTSPTSGSGATAAPTP